MDPNAGASPPPTSASMTDRMIGAATLDIATYEAVEHDTTATSQAAIVVGIVAVASAVGGVGEGTGGVIAALLSAYIGWLIWAGVTYLIGDKLLGGTATWGELLRTLGFAQSPGVFYVLAIIPFLGWIARAIVWIWLLITGIVAIRQALDFGTAKAIVTAVLGLLAYVVVAAVFATMAGVGGMFG